MRLTDSANASMLALNVNGDFPALLAKLLAGDPIDPQHVHEAFGAMLSGAWTPVQVGAFAVALRMRGESSETIAAAVEAMRATMVPVEHDFPLLVDTCGTGGDGAHTLNLSSGAAVVVASCGVPVAKHGNRSASSRCGSADVFEAMGIPLDIPPSRQRDVLREAGIAFLFAQAHHPALRHAGQARRELGTRTIFNVLGPLANPARVTHQLVGVYEDALRPVLARALGSLGVKRAWVVRGEDGLDEVSPCAPTRVSELKPDRNIHEFVIAPEDFGIARTKPDALAGGDPAENAQALGAILRGENHPAREAVVLNAAAALAVATADPPRACAQRARKALDDGAARHTLERWMRAARHAQQS
ncbi:MAG TPA: anthranilate phosphoribosyltransferase [Polyangiaceae bacterium]|jgi:anthranilate phosphoribosyltransferase|nr:anthranilate phosphoribosyltransferase [Polyangiaceae bacterium]